jgi:thiosulfate/3-mercaptopyruvate sulfurtransferase
MATTTYAHPEMLVSTDWVAQHLDDRGVRLIEVDVDTTQYEHGHIRGAIGWNWQTQIQDPVRRDIIPKEQLAGYLSQASVSTDSQIVLYGDNNNWFAADALWLLQYYGHNNVRLMNGVRKKWILEGRELTREVTVYSPTKYQALKLQPTL